MGGVKLKFAQFLICFEYEPTLNWHGGIAVLLSFRPLKEDKMRSEAKVIILLMLKTSPRKAKLLQSRFASVKIKKRKSNMKINDSQHNKHTEHFT